VELDRYTWRANHCLRAVPAAARFVSAEPLLGPLPSLELDHLHWLITGGESGAHHRPCDPDWFRDLRDRCQAARVAFFHRLSVLSSVGVDCYQNRSPLGDGARGRLWQAVGAQHFRRSKP
jgi:protein gp37